MSDKNTTLKELIQAIDFRLPHLEDIEADNRKLLIKLAKQGNQIVNFLKECEITDEESQYNTGIVIEDTTQTNTNIKNIRELIDEFMDKHQELKELEEELQKNKDKLTPGVIGES